MILGGHEVGSISQVYAAFDAASHRVFREAMARSRGGVVRVSDLVRALAERERALCRQVLPEGWTAPAPPAGDDRPLVPMSNEPALRRLLARAYFIARSQPEAAVRISPSVLWAAVFVERQASARVDLEEVFRRLELSLPAECRAAPLVPRPVAATRGETAGVLDKDSADELIDQVLARWLAFQALPGGPEKAAEAARIAALAGQIVAASA